MGGGSCEQVMKAGLREFEVRKEVEGKLAERRRGGDRRSLNQGEPPAHHGGSGAPRRDHEKGDSRDIAAKKADLRQSHQFRRSTPGSGTGRFP
jgi:hypothetical protein